MTDSTKASERLSPCPFDKGQAHMEIDGREVCIQCLTCGVSTPWCADESGLSFNKAMAIDLWNTRTTPQTQGGLGEDAAVKLLVAEFGKYKDVSESTYYAMLHAYRALAKNTPPLGDK